MSSSVCDSLSSSYCPFTKDEVLTLALSSCMTYTNCTGGHCLGSAIFLGGGGSKPFACDVMTDQPTMQLTQVTMSKNIEYTLCLTIVLFTTKAGLTGSS